MYINDKPYEEINKVDKMITAGVAEEKITLEKGEYFVIYIIEGEMTFA